MPHSQPQVKLGKKLKKNSVALDIVNFGEVLCSRPPGRMPLPVYEPPTLISTPCASFTYTHSQPLTPDP